MRRMRIVLLGLVVIPILLFSRTASAADTGALGGRGGNVAYDLPCGPGRRVTGVTVKYGDVIDQIRLRCTKIAATGAWASPADHANTGWSGSDAPFPATNSSSANCGTNRFVTGFNAYSTDMVKRIQIICQAADASHAAAGDKTSAEAGAAATGGAWSGAALPCLNSGIANGAKGKRGWWLDSLALKCVDPIVPSAAPVLTRPKWSATAGNDVGWTDPAMMVQLQQVPHASRYRICLRDRGAATCYFREFRNAADGFLMNDDSLRFAVSIPSDRQGRISEWTAQACNTINQCGEWSLAERFVVLPQPPKLIEPTDPKTLTNSRTVTFRWETNLRAFAGYQLILLTAAPEETGFTVYNPTALALPNRTVRIDSQATASTSYELDAGLTTVIWTMASCADFGSEKGRRCYSSSRFRTLSVPAFFGFKLAPTFRHERCANCHAVVADSFVKDSVVDTDNGLPSNHSAVTSPDTPTCNTASCHKNALLPPEGDLQVTWHAPPSAMDFRSKTPAELCTMAKNPGGVAANAKEHLTQDPLVLWAVGSGAKPSGVAYPLAPPSSIAGWRSLIESWDAAGLPCN